MPTGLPLHHNDPFQQLFEGNWWNDSVGRDDQNTQSQYGTVNHPCRMLWIKCELELLLSNNSDAS